LPELVELTGIEPVTSWMPWKWSPSCAYGEFSPGAHGWRRWRPVITAAPSPTHVKGPGQGVPGLVLQIREGEVAQTTVVTRSRSARRAPLCADVPAGTGRDAPRRI